MFCLSVFFSLDRDENRFPDEISFAECLCQGCIIKHHQEMVYNSVPVFAELMVLRKYRCPHDSNQYVVKKDFIKVPVACTCVVPKYAEWLKPYSNHTLASVLIHSVFLSCRLSLNESTSVWSVRFLLRFFYLFITVVSK